jgi:hypothetical protein
LLNTPLFFFSAYLLLHHIAWFRSWFFKRVEAVKSETEVRQKKKREGKRREEKRREGKRVESEAAE